MIITKTQLKKLIKEEMEEFIGGSTDIQPLDDEEQEQYERAYYDLFNYLSTSDLPGEKPSEKLKFALRWIAKFNLRHTDVMGKPFTGSGSGADELGPLHPDYKRKIN